MNTFKNTFALLLISLLFSSCIHTDKVNNLKLGNEYAKDGLYREAATFFSKALAVNEKNHHARRNLGVVQVKLGLYQKAIYNLEDSVQHLSKNFQNNYYLAEAYRASNSFDKA
ncbi:hypothetical protein N9W79_02380, partial [bacterium]|nr:hypothetical protein [bacterium]